MGRQKYRAFYDILCDYKYLWQEKRRTYLHSHRKTKKFFFTTREVRCVHHGWHGTHRYDIQVLAKHESTWVHRYSSLLQWSVPLGQRGQVAMLGRTPKGTDQCSSEEYRCANLDACVARTWTSYRCVPCHPWCTYWTSLVVKKLF
jgi:hypothetical protein